MADGKRGGPPRPRRPGPRPGRGPRPPPGGKRAPPRAAKLPPRGPPPGWRPVRQQTPPPPPPQEIRQFNASVNSREGVYWKKDLFHCMSDTGICCRGCWCPCCLAGNSAGAIGEECFFYCVLWCCFPWCAAFMLRRKARKAMDIVGGCNDDFVITCCCPEFINCQVANEINYRKAKGQTFKKMQQAEFLQLPKVKPPPELAPPEIKQQPRAQGQQQAAAAPPRGARPRGARPRGARPRGPRP